MHDAVVIPMQHNAVAVGGEQPRGLWLARVLSIWYVAPDGAV